MNDSPPAPESDDSTEAFLRLLSEHERAIRIYVLAMVPDRADADDILQDTRLTMWREFGKFERGSNFRAWGRKIAYHRILAFRTRRARESKRLVFTDAFYEAVDSAAERREAETPDRATLRECLASLLPDHRRIVRLRYEEQWSIEAIARDLGRSVGATYRVLSRIRAALRCCLKKSGDMQIS